MTDNESPEAMADGMMNRIHRANDETLLKQAVIPWDILDAEPEGEPVTVRTQLCGDFQVDPEAAEVFERAEALVEDQLYDSLDHRTNEMNYAMRLERLRIFALRATGYWTEGYDNPFEVRSKW